MGQAHPTHNFQKNDWHLVDKHGNKQIYKNQNNQLAQKNIVYPNPKIEQNQYLEIYNQRYAPNKPIVNVYQAYLSSQDLSMCRGSSVLTVFTQFIPYRLKNIKKLSQGQGMYILSQALAGFAQLYTKVGSFQIHQDLIGFNKDGQVKVWYNTNFAQNSVDNDRVILMSTKNPYNFDMKFEQNQQYFMVQDIFDLIGQYCNFNNDFINDFKNLRNVGFHQASRYVSYQINKKQYYVPDYLNINELGNFLFKSGIKSKHSQKMKTVVNIQKRQNFPYFYNNNQQNHIICDDQTSSLHHINMRRNLQLTETIKPIQTQHVINYKTQESIVHPLPQYQNQQSNFYENRNHQVMEPHYLHRHKIFQNVPPRLARQI